MPKLYFLDHFHRLLAVRSVFLGAPQWRKTSRLTMCVCDCGKTCCRLNKENSLKWSKLVSHFLCGVRGAWPRRVYEWCVPSRLVDFGVITEGVGFNEGPTVCTLSATDQT